MLKAIYGSLGSQAISSGYTNDYPLPNSYAGQGSTQDESQNFWINQGYVCAHMIVCAYVYTRRK